MTTASVDRTSDDLNLTARQQNLVLAALLLGALIMRVIAVLHFPGPHFPDEVYQSFEQAHRWAFGSGVLPWEFRTGIRSPVLPALFTGLFRLVEPWVGGPMGYLVVARTLLAGLSLLAVAAVYRMGLRESVVHGVIAGFVAATWFEIVYFAGRPLTEAIATTFLLVALSLATPQTQTFSARRLMAIGFCLALCLTLRIQLAPGLLVCAAFIARVDISRWLWLAIGGLLPVTIFGVADWYVWGTPFISYWRSIVVNVVDGRASMYGEMPVTAYVSTVLGAVWAGASAIILVLCMLRWRASMLWIVVALTIVATHMAIPHKEYRFVFPATACLIIVAALSSADLVRLMMRKLAPPFDTATGVRLACLIWLVTSASLGLSPGFRDQRIDRAPFDAQLSVAKLPDLCGLLVNLDDWTNIGGYAYLHRNVPIYFLRTPSSRIADTAPAFNVIMAPRYAKPQMPNGFAEQTCFDSASGHASDVCVFKRAGTCTPNPEIDVNRYVLERGD